MTPRPLYRWKSFWLGVLVLGFLGWIWGAYFRKPTTACWGTRQAVYCLGWGGSVMAFVVNKRSGYTGLEGSPDLGFYTIEEPLEPGDEVPLFAQPLYLDEDRLGIFVGHWVLVAAFLPLWSGWLIWRRRCERRKLI